MLSRRTDVPMRIACTAERSLCKRPAAVDILQVSFPCSSRLLLLGVDISILWTIADICRKTSLSALLQAIGSEFGNDACSQLRRKLTPPSSEVPTFLGFVPQRGLNDYQARCRHTVDRLDYPLSCRRKKIALNH